MPRNKTFNKDFIVKDALHLFWKYGFHQTSIQYLVKNLGINRASLYDTYGDKEGLFIKCFDIYKKEKIDLVKEIFNKEENPKEGLQLLFNFLLDTICEDPEQKGEFISNTLSEFIPKNGSINKYIEESKEEAFEILEAYLLNGLKKGYIKKGTNIEGVTYSIMSTAIGSMILSKMGSPNQTIKKNLCNNLEIILS